MLAPREDVVSEKGHLLLVCFCKTEEGIRNDTVYSNIPFFSKFAVYHQSLFLKMCNAFDAKH